MSRYQKLTGFSFFFFFHWNIDMKKKRQNKIESTLSHSSFVHVMLRPAVCKATADWKYCPRTVVLSHSRRSTVSHVSPHCSVCPAASEGQEDWGLGLASLLAATAGHRAAASGEPSPWGWTPAQPACFLRDSSPPRRHRQQRPHVLRFLI